MPKLGNFLSDLGSFAAPAATSAGLTVLSSGTLNPGTQAGLLSLLGAAGAGAGGFARNEQEERLRKAQKQQGKNQAMANLINTLNPRANYQARQAALPSPGTLETLASGTQQGIQAFRMAQQAQQALEDRAIRNEYLKAQTDGINARTTALSGASEGNALKAAQSRGADLQGRFAKTADVSKQFEDIGRYTPKDQLEDTVLNTPVQMVETQRFGNPAGPDAPTRLFTQPLGQAMANSGEGMDSVRSTALRKGLSLAEDDSLTRQTKQQALNPEMDPGDIAAMEDTLRTGFTRITADFRSVRDSYATIQELASQADNPMAHEGLMFAIMKMYDPRSTVKETEKATVENAAGVPTRIRNMWNKLIAGEPLAPAQMEDIVSAAEGVFQAQQNLYNSTYDEYKAIAERRGLDINNIAVGGAVPTKREGAPTAEPEPAVTGQDMAKFDEVMSTPTATTDSTGVSLSALGVTPTPTTRDFTHGEGPSLMRPEDLPARDYAQTIMPGEVLGQGIPPLALGTLLQAIARGIPGAGRTMASAGRGLPGGPGLYGPQLPGSGLSQPMAGLPRAPIDRQLPGRFGTSVKRPFRPTPWGQ